jgi:predicted ATPase
VIGKVFWWGAVAELAPEELAPHVGTYLQALVRRNLIRPERSTFAGEDCFGFHHILIQEAAYRGTPKEQRADLHERFASWIERMAGDRLVEFEEVIGYHLEQSYHYRAELGTPVDELRPLGRRAGRPLASAGARALERRDMSAATELLGRATTLLPEDDADRLPVLLGLGETRTESGDLEGAEAALDEAERLAEVSGDGAAAANASILRLFLLEWSDPKRLPEDPTVGAERLIRRLDELGDDRGVARAWRLIGDLYAARSRYAEADGAFERAMEHARRAGDRREEADARGRHIGSGVYGPAPVDEVARRCDEALAAVGGPGGAGGHEAPVLRALAVVRGMEGRFDEARELAARAREILRDRGLKLRATWVSETSGTIERLAGDLAAAEREFRRGFDEADELGDNGFRATVAAALAHTLVEQRRLEEADELVHLAETSAAEDDLASQVLWRATRGRMLALSGSAVEAQAVARDAITLAESTDDINMHADALADLAEVFAGGEDPTGAMDALDRAIDLYERKGNVVASASARRRRIALEKTASS